MSTYTPFESEMLTMMTRLTSDVSELKSDVSELKSDMKEVKGRLSTIEIWNDKAFGAIEDLRVELKSDGAATRGMIYEAYDQVADIKDILNNNPKSSPSPTSIPTRYPRVATTR